MERRFVGLDFESGRITAWVKVTGGQAHRVMVMGPFVPVEMREFPFNLAQLQEFRERPVEFVRGATVAQANDGPEAA